MAGARQCIGFDRRMQDRKEALGTGRAERADPWDSSQVAAIAPIVVAGVTGIGVELVRRAADDAIGWAKQESGCIQRSFLRSSWGRCGEGGGRPPAYGKTASVRDRAAGAEYSELDITAMFSASRIAGPRALCRKARIPNPRIGAPTKFANRLARRAGHAERRRA
jgi:hypothetical protein